MANTRIVLCFALIYFGILFFSGCSVDSGNSSDDEIQVFNDEDQLNQRVTDNDNPVTVSSISAEPQKIDAKKSFDLNMIAEVAPPVIDGVQVQATMVNIFGNSARAAVSYNVQGENYLGAVDAIQITSSHKNSIRIKSGIEFRNAKANAVHFGESGIWVAHSSEDPDLTGDEGFSAARMFDVSGFKINDHTVHTGLPGFAANSITETDGTVYVTSGNNAGLTVANSDLTEKRAYIEIPGARWVDTDDSRIVVVAGNPETESGTVYVIDKSSFEIIDEHPFKGADTPEAKSTIEIKGDLALIAAGRYGTHLMDITTGEILVTIPLPDHEALSLAEGAVETNAASADEEFIFISNGEAGVYVAKANMDLNQFQSGQHLEVELIGHLSFDEYESVNHVSYRNNFLFVASGLGGVKVVSLSRK